MYRHDDSRVAMFHPYPVRLQVRVVSSVFGAILAYPLWCCSCRVVCCVGVFLLCVCMCGLFLFLHPVPPYTPFRLQVRVLSSVFGAILAYLGLHVCCVVVFLLCVCVCDLFLCLHPMHPRTCQVRVLSSVFGAILAYLGLHGALGASWQRQHLLTQLEMRRREQLHTMIVSDPVSILNMNTYLWEPAARLYSRCGGANSRTR